MMLICFLIALLTLLQQAQAFALHQSPRALTRTRYSKIFSSLGSDFARDDAPPLDAAPAVEPVPSPVASTDSAPATSTVPAPASTAPAAITEDDQEEEQEQPTKLQQPAMEAYDDPRKEISTDMRDKLRRELVSQGADPNQKAGNPILIIAAVIAVLVIAGGKDILY